jgi:electron transport complex protein RnfD
LSRHASAPDRSVRKLMLAVLLGLLPGAALQALLLDASLPLRAGLAVTLALLVEALLLALRQRPLGRFLGDASAPITGLLLALLLPALTPWWTTAVAVLLALAFGKHLFGGLGDNPFNPAMVGYAAVLLLFPAQVAQPVAAPPWLALGSVLTAGAYALPAAVLAWRRQIAWQAPLALLAATALASVAEQWAAGVPAPAINPLAALSVSLVLAAGFVVTDPVTGCLAPRGRLAFGAGVGALCVWLAPWPGSADGLPFAVLAMNCLASWIDRHTRPARMPQAAPVAAATAGR